PAKRHLAARQEIANGIAHRGSVSSEQRDHRAGSVLDPFGSVVLAGHHLAASCCAAIASPPLGRYQWDISNGRVVSNSMSCVMPPRMVSRSREWPYAPMTISSAP